MFVQLFKVPCAWDGKLKCKLPQVFGAKLCVNHLCPTCKAKGKSSSQACCDYCNKVERVRTRGQEEAKTPFAASTASAPDRF